MTINVYTQFVCEWCDEVHEEDGVGADPIRSARANGWLNDSGHDFCCEVCFDKHLARVQDLALNPK